MNTDEHGYGIGKPSIDPVSGTPPKSIRVHLCSSVATPFLVLLALATAACSGPSVEDRTRAAAEEVRQSISDVDGPALEQKVEPQLVKEIQQLLQERKEYFGEINGEFDAVTLNALQAFQRSAGLRDDGFVNERTLAALRARPAAK